MQKQFRYIYNGKEVSKEDFEKLAGDSFKWFDGDSIVSVPFSSFSNFFSGDYRSNRQVNDHVKEVLSSKVKSEKFKNLEQNILKNQEVCNKYFLDNTYKTTQEKNTNSTRHKSQAGETHTENLVYVKEGTGYDYLKRRMKDDVITSSNRGEKETMEYLQGVKETEGKTDYSEINLEILDLMAERFTANKHKYPRGNMKKPIDIKSLEWALFRHVKKMIQPIETDEETYKDHLSAVLCNCSMLYDQLKVK